MFFTQLYFTLMNSFFELVDSLNILIDGFFVLFHFLFHFIDQILSLLNERRMFSVWNVVIVIVLKTLSEVGLLSFNVFPKLAGLPRNLGYFLFQYFFVVSLGLSLSAFVFSFELVLGYNTKLLFPFIFPLLTSEVSFSFTE